MHELEDRKHLRFVNGKRRRNKGACRRLPQSTHSLGEFERVFGEILLISTAFFKDYANSFG
jgi:hypothetical protein